MKTSSFTNKLQTYLKLIKLSFISNMLRNFFYDDCNGSGLLVALEDEMKNVEIHLLAAKIGFSTLKLWLFPSPLSFWKMTLHTESAYRTYCVTYAHNFMLLFFVIKNSFQQWVNVHTLCTCIVGRVLKTFLCTWKISRYTYVHMISCSHMALFTFYHKLCAIKLEKLRCHFLP